MNLTTTRHDKTPTERRIWGRENSSNVQKVLWTADELGLDYERIDAGGRFGLTDAPHYRALNPNGLIPTLQEGEDALWESNTIMRFLATRAGAVALLPDLSTATSIRRRAEVEKWMDWSSTAVAPGIFPAFWGLLRTPAAERNRQTILESAHKTAALMSIADTVVSRQAFLAGEEFTLADIPLGVMWWRWLNLPWETVDYQRPEQPHLAAWGDRLRERPAFRKRVMLPLT